MKQFGGDDGDDDDDDDDDDFYAAVDYITDSFRREQSVHV